jgi:hypothetical protein
VTGTFERFIGIDWSGAAKASGQQVYVAEAHRHSTGITVQCVVRARDRSAVQGFLRGRELERAPSWGDWPAPAPLDNRARRVVGLDFAFGFPTSFEHPGLENGWTWRDLTRWAAGLDGAGTQSVRRSISEDPALARQFRLTAGEGPAKRWRATDVRVTPRPESVFHLIGPSQVGIGSLTGIAMLHRVRRAEGLAVWPFDSERKLRSARVVVVEVFPRMWLEPRLHKNELPDRVRQVELWEHAGVAFHTKAELAAASSGDALDATAAAIGLARSCYTLPSPSVLPEDARRREGWIVGAQVPG